MLEVEQALWRVVCFLSIAQNRGVVRRERANDLKMGES
jgi:hypothetical protein